MADFTPQKLDISKINNGQKFENGDGITADTLNLPIEAVAYMSKKMETLSSATVVLAGGEPVETFDADTKVDAEAEKIYGSYVQYVYVYSYENKPARIQAVSGNNTENATQRRLAQYNDTGHLGSPNDPIEDWQYCRKAYVDKKVASKVGMGFGDSDHKYAYSYDHWTDTDTVYRYIWTTGTVEIPTGLYVPLYNGGKLSGNAPTKPYEYANKTYVDGKFKKIEVDLTKATVNETGETARVSFIAPVQGVMPYGCFEIVVDDGNGTQSTIHTGIEFFKVYDGTSYNYTYQKPIDHGNAQATIDISTMYSDFNGNQAVDGSLALFWNISVNASGKTLTIKSVKIYYLDI